MNRNTTDIINELLAENAALKSAIEAHKHGFIRCECCGEENMCHNDDVCRVLDETPATDAAANALRAEVQLASIDSALCDMAGAMLNRTLDSGSKQAVAYAECADMVGKFAKQLREGK